MKAKQKQTQVKSFSSTFWLLIGLVFIVLFTYYKVIHFDFVWDDKILYLNKERLIQKFNLMELFTPQKDRMYIPITFIFWKLVGEFVVKSNGDFQPLQFHLFNLILHIVNSVLVFFIIRKILKDDLLTFIGSIFFALHPIQVESVAWISEARGLLSACFGFSAMLLNIEYFNKPKRSYFLYIWLLLVLSILSKPSGIVFSLILVVYNVMNSNSISFQEFFKKNWIYLIFIVPFAIVAGFGESTKMIDFEAPLWFRPVLFFNSIGFYIYKIFLPFDFSPGYGLSPKYLLSHPNYLLFSIVGIVVILSFFLFKDTTIRFSILLFVIGFLPVSNIITFYYQYWSTVADRYIYISMVGICVLFPYLLSQFFRAKKIHIVVLLNIFLAVITERETRKWQNEFTLWSDCIEKYPNRIPHPYLGRGLAFLEMKRYSDAINDFTECIKIDSTYLFAYYNRGNVFLDLKNYNFALKDFTKAIEINNKYTNALVNRGITFMELSQFDNALVDFTSALLIDSNQYDALYFRGFCYLKLAKIDSALNDFERCYSINPNDLEIWNIIQELRRKKDGDFK